MFRTTLRAASAGRHSTLPGDDGKVSPVTCGGVDSTGLLRGRKTVTISHNGMTYRLQASRLDKLILKKPAQ